MTSDRDYMDESLAPERRVELLLAHMTLEEKIGQMCQYVGEISESRADNPDEIADYALALGDKLELVRAGKIGSFLKVPGAAEADYLQSVALESRLGIPLLIGTDAIHGHGMDLAEATIFPSPISIAASFDVELAERIAECTARELRATGFHWSFSPNVDVVRDARWGRTGETFGEDPWLVGELGAAMVRGYEGPARARETRVLSCAKHLVGGGAPENGLNGAPIEVSERTLHEVYYPPFEKCVAAGTYTVMPSHNEVAGVPCHADAELLIGLLRERWGFSGFVVSDWLDIARLHTTHRIAQTRKEADRLAVMAGVDMHMHGGEFFDNVRALALEGAIPLARVDRAAASILLAKFRLGLFERRFSDRDAARATVLCAPHRELALEAARKSLVLLKNNGVLPLSTPSSLLVTGPCADDQSLLGDWARYQPPANVPSVRRALEALAPAGCAVTYVETGPIAAISDEQIAAATKAAGAAQVVVAVIGENSLRDNPERTSGENVDRVSLEPPGRQLDLVRSLVATGRPVVVVLINGAPIASEWLAEHAAAIVEAWEPGMCGGTAIAETLFGAYNPSGKLPMTIPRSAGHIKAFYNRRPSTHHRGKLRFGATDALFEFGHGLSYTTFTYRALRAAQTLAPGAALDVEIDVQNTGSRAGEEVVLLYLQDVFASVTRPVKELKACARVALQPGATATVRFRLEPQAFSLLDRKLLPVTEPGEFRLSVGQEQLFQSVWLQV